MLFGKRVYASNIHEDGFVKVKTLEGDVGYIYASQLREPELNSQKDIRISAPSAPIYKKPSKSSGILLRICFNTELSSMGYRRFGAYVHLGNGVYGWLHRNDYIPIHGKEDKNIPITTVLNKAKEFIGTPYLWGGITPYGWDCSGFIQAILKQFEIAFPRDTKDQIKKGRKIIYGNHRIGDFVFFTRHIAMFIDEDKIIHSSLHYGGVSISFLGKSGGDYEQTLFRDIKSIKRVLLNSHR